MANYIWHPCARLQEDRSFPPPTAERAEGIYIYDDRGKQYMDMISSWWCTLLGHGNPRLNAAAKVQIDKMEHVIFAGFTHRPAEELCERLTRLLPQGLNRFLFVDNGSSAVEVAMKLSYQYHYQTGKQEKQRFMALSGDYHGETIGALSVGGMDRYTRIFEPLLLDAIHVQGPDCYRCAYGEKRETCQAKCIEKAEKAFAEHGMETTAFLLEPILQGAAGMRIYPPVYLQKIRELCDAYDINLIADEIATGFGRTGKLFACEHAGIAPDIMCVSKGLTGGYFPMAITITTQTIQNAFYGDHSEGRDFIHSTTYGGHPVACAAAVEVLNILEEEKILENMESQYLNEKMEETLGDHKNTGEIRSVGLINAVELVEDWETKKGFDPALRIGWQISREAMKRGLLIRPIGDLLYFNPPLTITKQEIDQAVHLLKDSVVAVLGQ